MIPGKVGMYTCGMTVYDYAHIGHGRKYVTDDILKRALIYNGYEVKHVQNVTDVGHLVSDADSGEDKMEKGAKKTGKTVWEVAEFYEKHFYASMEKLNIINPDVVCKATEHIAEQQELIEKLFVNGFAYDTPEAVYFDVTKDPGYGALTGQKLADKKKAVREEVETGEYKKNPQDFALWFKRVGRFTDHSMHWASPWGDGFPGWHIECSAMSMKYLGEQFDIHTGGEDHIPVHHPNEIAQSEGASGKRPFVNYWLHTAFLTVDGTKMSKSLGNFYTLEDVEKRAVDPLALRYFYLGAHYKSALNFTWEALTAAQNSLNKLKEQVFAAKSQKDRTVLSQEKSQKVDMFQQNFKDAINDDLNTPQALAVLWSVLKSNIPSEDKYDLAINFDEVLGLRLAQATVEFSVPSEIQDLITQRENFRQRGQFNEADEVRLKIENMGFKVLDSEKGTIVKPS